MNRLFALILVFALCTSGVFAQRASKAQSQRSVTTWSKVAFAKVRNDDGSYSVSSGAPISVTITPIKLANSKAGFAPPAAPPIPLGGRSLLGASFDTTVYQNDSGSFFVAQGGNSCLDDIVQTAAGNGKAWTDVSFGVFLVGMGRTGNFLVRWRGYETYTPGLGVGAMAFSNEMFDFGFYLNRADFLPGAEEGQAFLVSVNLSLNPLGIVNNQTCYLAQQFRDPHPSGPTFENGEGPFTNVWNVFASAGPQVGSSQDQFSFDFPADGVYDETEWDQFDPEEGGAGAGNFLFKSAVGTGQTTTVFPFTYNWFRGAYQSGNVGSLWFNDSNYNVAKAGLVLFPSEPPAQIVVESFSPTFTPAGMRLDAEAKGNTPGLSMRIEFWNYVTSQWVEVANAPLTTSDSTLIGFSANPSQCVQAGTGNIRAKVSFRRTGLTLVYPWTVSVDRIVWTISAP